MEIECGSAKAGITKSRSLGRSGAHYFMDSTVPFQMRGAYLY
jgi:hypothetical protein